MVGIHCYLPLKQGCFLPEITVSHLETWFWMCPGDYSHNLQAISILWCWQCLVYKTLYCEPTLKCSNEQMCKPWWWWWWWFSCQVVSDSCDPMDCSPPGSSVHGIFQARILEWIAISFSRGSSRPRSWTWVSYIAGRFFTDWAMREWWINKYLPHWHWNKDVYHMVPLILVNAIKCSSRGERGHS